MNKNKNTCQRPTLSFARFKIDDHSLNLSAFVRATNGDRPDILRVVTREFVKPRIDFCQSMVLVPTEGQETIGSSIAGWNQLSIDETEKEV